MENSIWRNDVKHEEHVMQTMWRIAYGEMISSIWRNDVKHEENALPTMWRIAYGEMMSNMRSMSCKPCGE